MPPKRPSSPVDGSSSNTAKSPATAASRERRAGNGNHDADVDERGEFEDAWEDEFEDEEIDSGDEDEDADSDDDVDGQQGGMGKNRVTGMEDDVDGQSHKRSLALCGRYANLARSNLCCHSMLHSPAMGIEIGGKAQEEKEDSPIPYLPGLGQGEKLAEDEELVADMSCKRAPLQLIVRHAHSLSKAYVFLHHARLTWPCLSFDILRDVCKSIETGSFQAHIFPTEPRRATHEGSTQRLSSRRNASRRNGRTFQLKRDRGDALRGLAQDEEAWRR